MYQLILRFNIFWRISQNCRIKFPKFFDPIDNFLIKMHKLIFVCQIQICIYIQIWSLVNFPLIHTLYSLQHYECLSWTKIWAKHHIRTLSYIIKAFNYWPLNRIKSRHWGAILLLDSFFIQLLQASVRCQDFFSLPELQKQPLIEIEDTIIEAILYILSFWIIECNLLWVI